MPVLRPRSGRRPARGAAVVVALALVACGGGDGTASDDGTTSLPQGTATVVETPTGRTVSHPLGEVEVPLEPERVVALGEEFLLADLLDLGVTPVASTATSGAFTGLDAGAVADIIALPSTEPDLERLIELEPDVIVTDVGTAELAGYDRLSDVAPTVAVDGSDWRQSYLDTAAVFGREDRAGERLDGYDDDVARARDALRAEGRSVSVATVYPGDSLAFWVDGPTNVPQVLLDLGFALSPGPDDDIGAEGGRAYVSAEQVDRAGGDDLVMLQSSAIDGEDAAYQAFTDSALWRSIPAVAADRVLVVDRLGFPGTAGRVDLVALFADELAR